MSLRLRLLLSVSALVVACLAVTAWIATRITSVELNRLAAVEEKRRLETELTSLADVLEVTDSRDWRTQVKAWPGSFDALLFDAYGKLVEASDDRYLKARLVADDRGVTGEIAVGEEAHHFKLIVPQRWLRHAGERYRLYLLPPVFSESRASTRRFQASAVKWTLLLVSVLGLLALFVAATVASRLTGPIEELAEALRSGDLSRRLEVRGTDEIARLSAAFNDLASKIEHGERLRRNMVSDVAHELRTPLSNLRCEVESLEDGLLKPSAEVLASVREEVVHLQRLVEDLQELALAEAGEARLDRESVDLQAEVASTLRGFENGEKPLGLRCRIEAGVHVLAEPRRLRQILVNLVDNACRHAPTEGRVEISAESSGDEVTVRVADSGPGIPPERREEVFERFVRLDAARQRTTGGSGLGLAIVKRWVEAHGGRIWVEDPPDGHGTVLAFTLPNGEREIDTP